MSEKRKISKEKAIQECTDMIFTGISTGDIVRNFTEKYGVSRSAVEKWMKIAKPAALDRQREAERVRVEQTDVEIIESLKQGLKSDLELEAFLCQIAMGDVKVSEMIAGTAVLRDVSPGERLKAVDLIYKKRGSFAATKADLNVSGGLILIEENSDPEDEPIKD